MSTYQKFDNEEEIKIDVVDVKELPINIILRNPSNEDIKYKLDLVKTNSGKALRIEIAGDKLIKMFFKGRPFKDENNLADFSIKFYKFLELTNGDVILYMIVDAPIEENSNNTVIQHDIPVNVESVLQSSNAENLEQMNRREWLNRGFNRFRNFGVDLSEIHLLRILFHTAHISNTRQSKFVIILDLEAIDWSAEAVINREEEWLNSNNPSFVNQTDQLRLNPMSLLIFRASTGNRLEGNSNASGIVRIPILREVKLN